MEPFTRCPHCGSCAFRPGPRGGVSLNVFCLRCRARYNIALLPDGYYLDQEISPPEPDPPHKGGETSAD